MIKVKTKITFIHEYSSFKNLLNNEDLSKILPDCNSIREGISIYENIPEYIEKAKRYGVVAVGLELISQWIQ